MKALKTFDQPHPLGLDEHYHALDLGNVANVLYWQYFFDLTQKIPGDIVECGVGRGRSLLIICALNFLRSNEEGGQRHIFAYDSFEGFPNPSPEDASPRQPKRGEWSTSPSGQLKYSPELIDDILQRANLGPEHRPKLQITKGFFGDTLVHHPERPVALLHVDGDLYQSYMDTLHHLFPKVSPGGVVIFDDFKAQASDSEKFPGARKAVHEYLGDRIQHLKTSPGGTTFYQVPLTY